MIMTIYIHILLHITLGTTETIFGLYIYICMYDMYIYIHTLYYSWSKLDTPMLV